VISGHCFVATAKQNICALQPSVRGFDQFLTGKGMCLNVVWGGQSLDFRSLFVVNNFVVKMTQQPRKTTHAHGKTKRMFGQNHFVTTHAKWF
jgi:hypothetical protein